MGLFNSVVDHPEQEWRAAACDDGKGACVSWQYGLRFSSVVNTSYDQKVRPASISYILIEYASKKLHILLPS